MKPKKFRLMFKFWLDDTNPAESDLIDYIETLKQERRFVTTIRDGLRLMRDLRAGNTTVLLQLFPAVKAQLQTNTELLTLIAGLMGQQPTRPLPAAAAPIVKEADPEERKALSIKNTLAALEDF